jgi:hypothetical protein
VTDEKQHISVSRLDSCSMTQILSVTQENSTDLGRKDKITAI